MELENKIQILDEKITHLLDEVKRLRSENASLHKDVTHSQEEAEVTAGELREANEALQSDLEKARQEIADKQEALAQFEDTTQANATREEDVRNRLRSIIEKIDAMEQASGSDE